MHVPRTIIAALPIAGMIGCAPQPNNPSATPYTRSVDDPVAAIRAILPRGWSILRVDENTYPTYRPEGKGTAIFLLSRDHRGHKQDEDGVIYIMPAKYRDGGEDPTHGQAQTYPPRLIATTPKTRIYLWGFGGADALGWPTMEQDLVAALTR